jgi:DNA-binding MarR family transcriptional regulator
MFFSKPKIGSPVTIGIATTDRAFKLYWLLALQEIKAVGQYEIMSLANYFQFTMAETYRMVDQLERRGLVKTSECTPPGWPAGVGRNVECTEAGLHYVRTTANALASSI